MYIVMLYIAMPPLRIRMYRNMTGTVAAEQSNFVSSRDSYRNNNTCIPQSMVTFATQVQRMSLCLLWHVALN